MPEAQTQADRMISNASLGSNFRAFFSSPSQTILSVLGVSLIAWIGWNLLDWAVIRAVWTTTEGTAEACRVEGAGACWAAVQARWRLILFGLYPYEQQWRSATACALMIGVAILSCLPVFWNVKRLVVLWVVGFVTFYILMRGGVFGLVSVFPGSWGGLPLTVFVYASVCLLGMPLAVCLALMRRSKLPVVSAMTAILIDSVRSLPLITILFTAAITLSFVLPGWMQGDQIYRVIIGFALFFAAYQAEIIRSGIQSLPTGQEEAARALGLSYFQRTTRIILPQAFRNALPPTINQFVINFKETSLLVIVGLFDLMASGQAAFGNGTWAFAYVEVYVFVGLIYFVFLFSLSRYGSYLEKKMRVGL
jgi:general L-amino acid transport system permease protein